MIRLAHSMGSSSLVQRMLIWLILLSLFDAIATDAGLHMHAITEANPLVASLYEFHPLVFYGVKIALPFLLFLLLRFVADSTIITRLVFLVTVVYSLVAIYHVMWMLTVIL
ncbi:DUF5658 family protein [Gorillibacterium massiliense]|uniref:DUF5658 family protein n=1 Tax=Gorillibacterium massiliense TaxID=1280390 RepID=UPI0004B4081B|nr:DUF5658 family protein [Gorillibacterium massiliense]